MILLSCQLKVLTDEVRESTFFGSICSKPIMKYVIGKWYLAIPEVLGLLFLINFNYYSNFLLI